VYPICVDVPLRICSLTCHRIVTHDLIHVQIADSQVAETIIYACNW